MDNPRDALLAACKAALLHLNEAPLEYRNGVTDPTGTMDEGSITGWRTHAAVVAELEDAVAQATGMPLAPSNQRGAGFLKQLNRRLSRKRAEEPQQGGAGA